SAPSPSACCAACWAPLELPPSSFTRSWTLGLLNSASAISAAFFIDTATVPALPPADSGRISATRTLPVPTSPGAGWACGPGPGGGAWEDGGFVVLNTSETPVHADNNVSAPVVRPKAQARRDNRNWTRGPGSMTSLPQHNTLAGPAHPSNPA